MAEKVFYATGRRKTSVARVYLKEGRGDVVVNDRPLKDYFGRETSRMIVLQPFEVTNTSGQYDAKVNVCGGGISGQAGAIRHGITRALMSVDAGLRSALKKAGEVTRDPRAVRRNKKGSSMERKGLEHSK